LSVTLNRSASNPSGLFHTPQAGLKPQPTIVLEMLGMITKSYPRRSANLGATFISLLLIAT
jgi:hypothetical protein